MTVFLSQHFDTLKKLVLTVAGFANPAPADCKALTLAIFKKTNQQISETTLKRVYGFAYSKFKPSLFTLDAMAKFCGYQGWADFCEKDEPKINAATKKDASWDNIKNNAEKITNFTLQALKNRSGIPYQHTIKRKFINDHFDAFLKDDYTATLFTAPAGYGKSIALCHWIEEKMELSATGANQDIILFFSSNALINIFISGKDINEWLLSLLGYSGEDDFSTLLDIRKKHEGDFYLIVDGLDEHMFKAELFHMLLNQVLDVFSFYQFYDTFKLVLTMRNSTWINHRHEVQNFKNKWFTGYTVGDDSVTNVPLFSVEEIKELSTNINPYVQSFIGIEVADNFNHPLYFQFYYKQHKDDFSLNNVDHVCIYELITTFILNKIYLGSYAAEKTLITKALVDAMDLKNEKYEVHKYKLNDIIRQYGNAYSDLLGLGFIREVNKSSELQYNAVIQFGNDNFLTYSLARAILLKHGNKFNSALIKDINKLQNNAHKLQILKWCITFAMKNGQADSFNCLAETLLTIKEKAEIVVFIGDWFERPYSPSNQSETMKEYFGKDCCNVLFDYFFGLEFINTDYKKTLLTLMKFELSAEKKILLYTSLAVIAVMQLDMNKLEENLLSLRSFSQDDLQALAINPLSCLETIFYFLKYGIVKKEAFIELTRFYFNPPKSGDALVHNSCNDILYLLGVYTLSICKNQVKVLRFIKAVKKIYQTEDDVEHGFGFMLKLMAAEASCAMIKKEACQQIYNELISAYEKQKYGYTPFMKASFNLLKVKMSAVLSNKADLEQELKALFYVADDLGFKLIKINALVFMLSKKSRLGMNADYYKRLYYDFIKIIRESGFKEESFIESSLIIN